MDTAGSAPPIATSNPRGILGQAARPAPCQHCRLLEAHFDQRRAFLGNFLLLESSQHAKIKRCPHSAGAGCPTAAFQGGIFPPSC